MKFAVFTSILCFIFLLFYQQPAFADSRIVINKGTNQLAFFEDGYLLEVFPVATGRQPELTPEGKWQVVLKLVNPSWQSPQGGAEIPGGIPENPLGPRWLGLNALGTEGNSYGIHGNNNPNSISTYASSGCVRMYNKDILWLYDHVPVGAAVEIISSSENLESWKKFYRVTVNGKVPDIPPNLGPVHAGDIPCLPVQPILKALGYRFNYNESLKTLRLSNIDREVLLTVGSNLVKVNKEIMTAEDAPFLLENIVFIPDYYFQRYFDAEVLRDAQHRTISLQIPFDPTAGGLVKYHLDVKVDRESIDLPESVTPLTDGENFLVPVTPICDAVGGKALLKSDSNALEVRVRWRRVSIPLDGSPARVNKTVIERPTHIVSRNGSLYIDLRFLAEACGFQADVDDESRTLNISAVHFMDMFYNPFYLFKSIMN